MEILVKKCLMPLALKTQDDSLAFIHELKKEMHADLKYVESLEDELDELESDKAEFSNMYDMLLQECVSKDVMCSYLLTSSDLDEITELQCLYLHKVMECDCLAQKLSEQTDFVVQEFLHCAFYSNFYKERPPSYVFRKEREKYVEIQDLKARNADKNMAISELKKLVAKCKGKSVDTKFDKPSVVRQPNAQRIPKPSVLGKPAPFSNSLERKYFAKKKSVLKTNESESLSKPASPTQAWLWHRRISHLNFDTIKMLSKKDIVNGLPKLKYIKDQLCSSCELSKAKRSLVPQTTKGVRLWTTRPRTELQKFYPLADTMQFQSHQELDLLFGPLYDEFFIVGITVSKCLLLPLINSVPQDTLTFIRIFNLLKKPSNPTNFIDEITTLIIAVFHQILSIHGTRKKLLSLPHAIVFVGKSIQACAKQGRPLATDPEMCYGSHSPVSIVEPENMKEDNSEDQLTFANKARLLAKGYAQEDGSIKGGGFVRTMTVSLILIFPDKALSPEGKLYMGLKQGSEPDFKQRRLKNNSKRFKRILSILKRYKFTWDSVSEGFWLCFLQLFQMPIIAGSFILAKQVWRNTFLGDIVSSWMSKKQVCYCNVTSRAEYMVLLCKVVLCYVVCGHQFKIMALNTQQNTVVLEFSVSHRQYHATRAALPYQCTSILGEWYGCLTQQNWRSDKRSACTSS
ncbi:retrovirus-related pol polyprotein from transposon TNT 1-94 [Tanacetum coccineum]|uniref:Retrovirus-related pol polyprotein from transposon TNT 1-94 n=1 Tax=Tanacetum coccineum TaxID=301880 RepID=A0ABQ5A5J5_9ASTR